MKPRTSSQLELFINSPIKATYEQPSADFIDRLQKNNVAAELKPKPGLLLDNSYHAQGIQGAVPFTYLRASVLERLEKALSLIAPDYGFVIFDGYRSKSTQVGLFDAYSKQIEAKYPHLSPQQLYEETRKFVAHPDEPSRFEVPPHMSGGAVDLGLTDGRHRLDMGTDFDDLSERAATDFFEGDCDPSLGIAEERWKAIQTHRRILFHTMREAGFTNWRHEWWHFDLGNCVWAQELGLPWIFDSMSSEVENLTSRTRP